MPEVVYPSPDKNGKSREWKNMFPELPNTHDGWGIINNTLYTIALNNRMGGQTTEELRKRILDDYNKQMTEMLVKNRMGNKKLSPKTIEKRSEVFNKWMKDYGIAIWYVNQVFDNLGGAYRESSSN